MSDDAARQAAARVASKIDALLPQTQCTRCGYPACRPYADAIARGEADINQCPPGGQSTIDAIAGLLDRSSKSLNPANGVESAPRVAVIDEERCIGCAKCLPACPVDAIVGAQRFMHTIMAAQCTGCELCLPPCPVDCIVMVPMLDAAGVERTRWSPAELALQAHENRRRFAAHTERRERERLEREQVIETKKRQASTWRRTEHRS